jgi:hypothetical protein
MPGALILSSLVIKITGFSAFVFAILQVTEIGGCNKIKGVDWDSLGRLISFASLIGIR